MNNRVNGVLAVTRALGDAYMKDLVTGHPYTTETVVQCGDKGEVGVPRKDKTRGKEAN